MIKTYKLIIISQISLFIFILSFCFENKQTQDQWNKWKEYRNQKFKQVKGLPIPKDKIKDYKELDFFDYNKELIFENSFTTLKTPVEEELSRTKGGRIKIKKVGTFVFELDNIKCRLDGYDYGNNTILIPFSDKTNGNSTYSEGRLLEVTADADGKYTLDFNYAYNPLCAYNKEYNCLIVPPQNRLNVSVSAGEKKFVYETD